MLVNKSGRRLVIGRINVRNGEILPGIPFTADERKGIEKFVKKGWIAEVEAESKPEPVAEAKVEPVAEAEPEPAAEVKPEPEPEPAVAAEPEPVAEEKAEKPALKFRRRKKAAEQAQEAVAENDGVSNND